MLTAVSVAGPTDGPPCKQTQAFPSLLSWVGATQRATAQVLVEGDVCSLATCAEDVCGIPQPACECYIHAVDSTGISRICKSHTFHLERRVADST
jgi:hypothetical protein